jgi:hypothetical protein
MGLSLTAYFWAAMLFTLGALGIFYAANGNATAWVMVSAQLGSLSQLERCLPK